ncbi:MAG TPA: LysM peptidoglycan-binding domain-containing protein [Phototrophicaceae bacterium]|nr:LysM peptidoglycan-binding domain-containing protein [Phototrophicaceae bacterium]
MKRILFVVLMLVLVLGAALPTFAQATPVASVNTGELNVRTGPGMQYGSVANLPFGFGVNMLARNSQGNWILIALTNGQTGWVNVQFLFTQYPTHNLPVSDAPVAQTFTPTGVVSGLLAMPLYTGPSLQNPVITTIPTGTTVTLQGRNYNSTLALVLLPDGVTAGWVQAAALTTNVPVRSLGLADGSVFVPNAPGYPGENTTGGTTGSAQSYTVQPGDTLWSIAQHFGVSMDALAAANNIWNFNLIYANQTLIIPG